MHCPAGKPYVREETRKPQPRCASPFLDQGDPPLHATVARRPVDEGKLTADAVLNQKVGKRFVNKLRTVVGAEGSRLPELLRQWLDGRQKGAEGVGDGVGRFILRNIGHPKLE